MLSPGEYYHQKKGHYGQLLAKTQKDIDRIVQLRLCVAIVTIIMGIWVFRSGGASYGWLIAVMVGLFLFLVRLHTRLSAQRQMFELYMSVIEHELQALQGNNSAFSHGSAYVNASHPYSYDLDIFGVGSIYQAVCRTVTVGGGALLAHKLSTLTLERDEITGRQDIVRELSENPDLLHDFRVAGMAVAEGADDQAHLSRWLQDDDRFINNPVIRVAVVAAPILSLACILWSVLIGELYPGLTLLVLVNWALLIIFQKRIKLSARQIEHSAKFIDKYESLLKHMAGDGFRNSWLQKVSDNAKRSLNDITALKKTVHLFEGRSNPMSGMVMNTLFLFDFYCLVKLETWRKKHRQSLLTAIEDVIAMDVYVSSSVYAFNHPCNIYAGITHGKEIMAMDLRHPLLSASTAVGNDFSLGSQEQFYLLTGANMTGKSTFIRTVGVSIVLTNIGLPLPAAAVSIPLLSLYTSMRITDSVQDDISYFRAELNRMSTIMKQVQHSQVPYLVLLDEPLRGTNSTDKQLGTRFIVEALLTCNAIGIVATHDTALCDMATLHPGKVSNYHFESKVEPGGLSFDFLIKPGGSTSNNATILMRQMGIIP